jgi:hypothetical protein
MNNVIKIKPHHFIDIITSFSADRVILKPHYYYHNVHSISKKILENRNALLEIDFGDDDICKPCIHNINGICDDMLDISNRPKVPPLKREWNLILDKRWCKRLKIDQGTIISVLEFCELLEEGSNNLLEIYKENKREHTIEREIHLKKGLKKYLISGVIYNLETE